jgi:SAM-dependent methyltransferase
MNQLTNDETNTRGHSASNVVLDDHSLATVTLGISWADDRASHENYLHVDRFSVFREADALPEEIAGAIAGMGQGAMLSTSVADTYDIGAWVETRQLRATPSHFDCHHRPGLMVIPRMGRFYPQGFFHKLPGIFEDAIMPARIVELNPQRLLVDLNHPMARFPFQVHLRIDEVLSGYDRRGGGCQAPLHELTQYSGLAASLISGKLTDFGDDAKGRGRIDEAEDSGFYQKPRMVQHLDKQALKLVNALYRRLIPRGAAVLDLMASYDSHLQGTQLEGLSVLGLNKAELTANSAATAFTVHDLNQDPSLPYPDDCLDAIVCTASIEYLIYPEHVLAEVKRVLRPRGLFVCCFSNRWFPSKAIRVWSDLHEFERVGMVTQWLQQTGFAKLATYSAKGWPRPSDDPHTGRTARCDPVYAVWGYKS